MANYFQIRMEHQRRFITTTEQEITQYRENELSTSDVVSEKIVTQMVRVKILGISGEQKT